uniref:Uncharacterized protein n=1 Tax=Neogobius melanostomus TaxID=47308 RepID=A0A8C6U1N0_9GOBI
MTKVVLNKGQNINKTDSKLNQNNAGYTAMMLASLTAPDSPSSMEVVRRLMELGNANKQSSQTGQTALHLAVRHGRVVMVRLLLSCGADANLQDKEGTTALMFASERGHTHIARLLLERSQCDLSLADKVTLSVGGKIRAQKQRTLFTDRTAMRQNEKGERYSGFRRLSDLFE